ncbi:MAG: adenylate/guanylate cyclase domain-containing protein [Desulfobacterales bacterium]|nr:adenylate/guanylate cyclase domain-containing protein [Desulfobacterales bacterium]
MSKKGYKRKLTAILSADVQGYSRLMGEDEEETVQTLTAYREVFVTLTRQHDGRVVDSPGDNLLVEFSSVVDAAQCAVAIQKELYARNEDLPENRRMQFRIGINLGDVIQEGDRIYGDGVNIAARLEALADPGGICIAKTAFDHIESKLPLGYEYLGEQAVKNISRPVGAYRVLMAAKDCSATSRTEVGKPFCKNIKGLSAGILLLLVLIGGTWHFYFRPAPVEKMVNAIPYKCAIAVQPFANLSDDPDQQYFSDGLTQEIITALSKVYNVSVIHQNSRLADKRKVLVFSPVEHNPGGQYVLQGSVQKAGERIRIMAQLIERHTGNHVWAERYDRDLKEVFHLQDEITKEIITALQVKLTMGEDARLLGRGTDNLEVYLKLLKARELITEATVEGNVSARQFAEEAIEIDPEYSEGYRMLGVTYFNDVVYGVSKDRKASLMQATELTQKAIDLDASNGVAYAKLGFIHMMMQEYEQAIKDGKQALALEPNSAYVLHAYGAILYFAGMNEKAIGYLEKAIRINPKPPNYYLHHYGAALRDAGRYEEAIAQVNKAIERKPNDILSYIVLASSYSMANREKEARKTARQVLRIKSDFSIEAYLKRIPHRRQAFNERFFEAMQKAGLN